MVKVPWHLDLPVDARSAPARVALFPQAASVGVPSVGTDLRASMCADGRQGGGRSEMSSRASHVRVFPNCGRPGDEVTTRS